jgi:hypothetical protein
MEIQAPRILPKKHYDIGIPTPSPWRLPRNYAKAEVRETKTIPVRQLKARDQDLYGFELREDFATMAILNMDDAEAGPSQTTSESDVDLNNDPELSYDAGQT